MPEFETIQRLLELSRSLSLSLDLEPFLQQVLTAASELTGSEVASVLEAEEGGDQLRFLAAPWFHREALQAVRVPARESIAGWVYQKIKPALVRDVAADPRHFKGADRAAEFVTRSLAAVPIVYKGEALGVLEAVNKTGSAHYTEEDLTILETLASFAAVAIQSVRLAERARKSLEEMRRLDQMKADFIAIASHELRTPLGLILGHSTFLREVIVPEYRPQLEIIVRNAMRLKEIVDNMANMDNVQRGMATLRRKPVSIRHVVEEVLDTFYEEAREKNISLRKEINPPDLLIECDASKLAVALGNLVKNALTFTDPGGHVLVAAEQIPGYLKVSVLDDGIGIPAKDLPHIFERFYQVESHLTRKHGGMGLGLSVAKVMIEMHDGRIWAESVEGKGSNFTFILPLASPSAPAEKAAG